jgi:hypothetical protein
MLGEDDIRLFWHIDTTPLGRARSQLDYNFERTNGTIVLPGRIAYERLRQMEQEDFKKQPSRRVNEFRERRQRLSEQPDNSSLSYSNGGRNKPSASHLRALAEYEAELAASDAKRRQAKEKEKYRSKL